MTMNGTRRLPLCWLLSAAVFGAGCEKTPRGPADLNAPGLEASKAALTASLEAWKGNRRESGVMIGSNPSIGVVDSTRLERPLLDYEVVGPLMVAEKARPFAVRLVLDSPRETVSARYLVLGRDPLWVFREEDFERMLHWEHKMDDHEEGGPPSVPGEAPAPGGR